MGKKILALLAVITVLTGCQGPFPTPGTDDNGLPTGMIRVHTNPDIYVWNDTQRGNVCYTISSDHSISCVVKK